MCATTPTCIRIYGVVLPDGVTGFGIVLDTSLIDSLALITGALPAEFGLRTVGLVDITAHSDIFNNSGSVSRYDGSRGTIAQSTLRAATALAGCAAGFPLSLCYRQARSACIGGAP